MVTSLNKKNYDSDHFLQYHRGVFYHLKPNYYCYFLFKCPPGYDNYKKKKILTFNLEPPNSSSLQEVLSHLG